MRRCFACAILVPLLAAFAQRPSIPQSSPPVPVKSGPGVLRWRRVFYHDTDAESLVISDFRFPSSRRGIAVGYLASNKGKKPKGVAVVTSNGGQSWDVIPLRSIPRTVFFLDDSTGWVVAEDGLYQTLESGRSWQKVKAPSGILRVFFKARDRGWAFGLKKAFYQTTDGGKNWSPVAAAQQPDTNPEYSVYLWMEFATEKAGLLVGSARPPRRLSGRVPSWLDPESAAKRAEWPATSLFLETRDGGVTWKPTTASLFGTVTRIRMLANGMGLSLFEFQERFDFPSEIVKLDLGTGKSEPCFRRKDRAITDVILQADGTAYAAGCEPPGRISGLPVPGKVKILKSDMADRKLWLDMPVDYRAVATRVYLASAGPDQLWAATDTGMILKLQPRP